MPRFGRQSRHAAAAPPAHDSFGVRGGLARGGLWLWFQARFRYACGGANHGRAMPCRPGTGCGMLPDIRFAIGAVLASCAVLIATAFGLAVAVRVAHHKAAGLLEASRVLAYTDAGDWPRRPTHRGTGERTAASEDRKRSCRERV